MGILHASVSPVVAVADVKPNLALVAVVLVTAVWGFLPGMTWAFVAGLTANLLVGAPLGSVPLALLLVAAVVAGGSRAFGRATWLYPIAAAAVGSALADVVGILLTALVGDLPLPDLPVDLIAGAALLNAAITAALIYPVRSAAARYLPDEAAAW